MKFKKGIRLNFISFKLNILILLIIFISFFSATISTKFKIIDEKKLYHLKESYPPIIYKNGILFTYKGKGFIVYLSGSFVDWEKKFRMKKSYFGVWFYLYKGTIGKGDYGYKFNVDNFWILDPDNKEIIRDERDHPLSLLHIPEKLYFYEISPIINGNKVTFWLKDIDADNIYLYGDFNNWNPYQLPLEREGDFWKITLYLNSGRYGYRFIINYDKEILDPHNPVVLENIYGEKCSIVNVKN